MDLLLPHDGSIVIIDDKYSEAEPLMSLLSKNGYSSIFFNGNIEQVPDTPLARVRCVFADIQLLPALNAQTYAQMIIDHLNKLISDSNGPYVLIIWSANLNAYADRLEEMVKAPGFAKKPIAIIRLNKNDYFKTVSTNPDVNLLSDDLAQRFPEADRKFIIDKIAEHFQDEKKAIKKDALNKISAKIRFGLKSYKAFELLIKWESSISKSATNFVADLSHVHKTDENWDFNFRNIISRLAYAQVGQFLKDLSSRDFVKSTFKTLNSAFTDSVVRSARDLINITPTEFSSYKESGYTHTHNDIPFKIVWKDYSHYELYINDERKGDSKKNIIDLPKILNNNAPNKAVVEAMIRTYTGFNPELNSRLNVDFENTEPFQPGILYRIPVPIKKKRKFLNETYFDKNKCNFSEKTKNGNSYKIATKNLVDFQFVELEVSPNCDFAQKKWLKHRVISGILYPHRLKDQLALQFLDDASLYTAMPIIKVGNEAYKLILSFRLLKSFDLTEADARSQKVLFRIKNEPMADILTRMTSHASRIGLIEFV